MASGGAVKSITIFLLTGDPNKQHQHGNIKRETEHLVFMYSSSIKCKKATEKATET